MKMIELYGGHGQWIAQIRFECLAEPLPSGARFGQGKRKDSSDLNGIVSSSGGAVV